MPSGIDFNQSMLYIPEHMRVALPSSNYDPKYERLIAKNYFDSMEYNNLPEKDQSTFDKQALQQKYGGMGEASLNDFKTLLNKLETSKINQQQAKDISSRANTYAQGLEGLMNNF